MSLLEQLNKLADAEYKAFNKKIIPTKQVVLGVRLPALRKIAKDICRNNPKAFLAANKNNIFEMVFFGRTCYLPLGCTVPRASSSARLFFCQGGQLGPDRYHRVWL